MQCAKLCLIILNLTRAQCLIHLSAHMNALVSQLRDKMLKEKFFLSKLSMVQIMAFVCPQQTMETLEMASKAV